jgi:hypothetical protein
VNRKLGLAALVGSAAIAGAITGVVIQSGWKRRANNFYLALNVALHEAVGHYRGTLEAIASGEVSMESARELLHQRPEIEVPNVGEAYADISLESHPLKLDELTLIINGPEQLLRFIMTACLVDENSTWLEVCGLTAQGGLGSLHIQLSPFYGDDKEMLNRARNVLGY